MRQERGSTGANFDLTSSGISEINHANMVLPTNSTGTQAGTDNTNHAHTTPQTNGRAAKWNNQKSQTAGDDRFFSQNKPDVVSRRGFWQSIGDKVKEDVSSLYQIATHPRELASALMANAEANLDSSTDIHLFEARMRESNNDFYQAISGLYNDVRNGNYDSLGRVTEELATSLIPVGKLLSTGKLAFFSMMGVKGAESLVTRRAYLNAKFGRTGNLNLDISKRGYLEKLSKYDFSTGPDTKIFYSGPANNLKADIYSQLTGKVTIDKILGGIWLKNQALYNRYGVEFADDIWISASRQYAATANGEVFVFANGASPNRVFNKIELPILQSNAEVTNINYLDHPHLDINYTSSLRMGY